MARLHGQVPILRLSSVVALAAICGLAGARVFARTDQMQVHGLGQKQCAVYFHHQGASLVWPLLFSLRGTGVYSTASVGRLDPSERALVEQGLVTVVTLDKPGISVNSDAGVQVDDGQYNSYTQEDLGRCSLNALTWAFAQNPPPIKRFYVLLSGHSEGSQVIVRLFDQMLRRRDPLAARIQGLFLSGLPMTGWRQLLSDQLSEPDRSTFFTALQRQDNAVLRSYGNLSYDYLSAVFRQEPLADTLTNLVNRGSDARFFIYQGLSDKNTPAAAVMAFVANNRIRRSKHQSSLPVRARFYPAGHALNARALSDIRGDIESLIHALDESGGHRASPQMTDQNPGAEDPHPS